MKKLFIFMVIITFLACKKEEKSIVIEKDSNDKLTKSSFEYKYKNQPKYFMKFWEKMSIEEFEKVKKQMKEEGLIDLSYDQHGIFFDIKIGENYIKFEPITENDIVVGILIPKVNEEIYNLYVKKYNLPKLVNVSIIGTCYKEINPCFLVDDCREYLKIDKNIKEISLNEVAQNTNYNENSEIYLRKGLSERRMEIKNSNCNIVLQNHLMSYSISLSQLNKGGEHIRQFTDFYYSSKNNDMVLLDNDIKKISKYRYVVKSDDINLEISYFPINYFLEQENKLNAEKLKQQKKLNKQKEKEDKLLKEI